MIYYSSHNTEDIKISEYYSRIAGLNKNKTKNSFSQVFVSAEQEHSSPWTIDEIPILGAAFT